MKSARRSDVAELAAGDIEISLDERTDALVLMATLIPFSSFLVQHTPEHWVVHARVPGRHDEDLDDLLATLESWASRRGLSELRCSFAGQVVELSGSSRVARPVGSSPMRTVPTD